MGNTLFRNAHYIFGVILFLVFAVWGGSWFWQRSAVEARMQAHLLALGAKEPLSYRLHGFPNRYDFRFNALTLNLADGVRLDFGAMEIDTLAYNDTLEIWAFDAPVSITTPQYQGTLGAESFRASVQYFEDSNGALKVSQIIVEGRNSSLNVEGQTKGAESFTLGYGADHEPRFALWTLTNQQSAEYSTESLDDLLSSYLQ